MSLILNVLGWVLGKLFSKPQGPSQEAVQAARAATAETAMTVEKTANVVVLKASVAAAAARRSVAVDDGLRQYESADPNNRDND